MGTWSHEPFGNDASNDWVLYVKKSNFFAYIEAALDNVLENNRLVLRDVQFEQQAVGSVELLAKFLGRSTHDDLCLENYDWIKSITSQPSASLLQKARQVIYLLSFENSNLHQLWVADDFEQWHASMSNLFQSVNI